jgi:hypothetical protein
VDTSSSSRTQRVLSSSVPECTKSQCPPGRVSLSQNVQQFYLLLLCTCAPARCPLGRALRILSDSASFEFTAEFLLQCTLCLCSMPTWQSFTELVRDSVCNCVFSHTALPPEVFNNLKGLPPELLISDLVPQHAFVSTPQCLKVHPLCTALRTRSFLSHPPGVKP